MDPFSTADITALACDLLSNALTLGEDPYGRIAGLEGFEGL